ncbi:class I SAM-dependent methyltransferase [uncultured Clostridium sp.]|uniref:class I SAM-dependent methyltransferase n=1 Tax=uncultured Clostridium sp. TaxID=59620 RepID=UPI00260AA8B5|nr:class I SAM-dependent methyltransferase [uncultured Clostridium sp.]
MNSKKYFNGIANEWNTLSRSYFKEELRDLVLNKYDLNGKVVADLGAGTGFMSLKASQKASIVFSLDVSKNMLNELNREIKIKEINNIYLLKSNFEKIPLFDESVDIVFMNMALHHAHNPNLVLKEIHRILKIGGRVVITDVMKHEGEWAKEEMFDVWLGFNEIELQKWYLDVGFKEFNMEDTRLEAIGESSFGEKIKPGIFLAEAIKL